MHPEAADAIVASVRRRASQGDCPTEPAQSVENLEDCLLEIASRTAPAAPLLDPEGVGAPSDEIDLDAIDAIERPKVERLIAQLRAARSELAGFEDATPLFNELTRQRDEARAALASSLRTPEPTPPWKAMGFASPEAAARAINYAARTPEEPTPWQGDEPLVTFDGGDWHHDVRSDRVRIGRMEYPRLAWISALRRLGNADASTCSAPRAPQGAAPRERFVGAANAFAVRIEFPGGYEQSEAPTLEEAIRGNSRLASLHRAALASADTATSSPPGRP